MSAITEQHELAVEETLAAIQRVIDHPMDIIERVDVTRELERFGDRWHAASQRLWASR